VPLSIEAAQPMEIRDEPDAWPAWQRRLPHVIAATAHAERLGVELGPTSWLLDRAATFLQTIGQPADARPLIERALAVAEQAYGADHLRVGRICNNLGLVLQELGENEQARDQYERALAITAAELGPDAPQAAACHNNLGIVLNALNDPAGARAQYERALELLDPADRDATLCRANLAVALMALDELEPARVHIERALDETLAHFGGLNPRVAHCQGIYAELLRRSGDLAEAREQVEGALNTSERLYGTDHPEMRQYQRTLDVILEEMATHAPDEPQSPGDAGPTGAG
jgi:tetratricopeptide (TPR) repeat protein